MPEMVVLSPVEYPLEWGLYIMKWGASLACVGFSVGLWQRNAGAWWIVLAIAFGLEPVFMVGSSAYMGVPPVPVGFFQAGMNGGNGEPEMIEMLSMSWDLGSIRNIIAAIGLWLGWRSAAVISEPGVGADSR